MGTYTNETDISYRIRYYQEHKIEEIERVKKWNKENPEKCRKSALRYYYKDHPKKKKMRNKRLRIKRIEIKVELFKLLGNKCVICGFEDFRALQLDHKNGKGHQERKRLWGGGTYYAKILEKVKAGNKDYQILCANCNWIKKWDLKEGFRILV